MDQSRQFAKCYFFCRLLLLVLVFSSVVHAQSATPVFAIKPAARQWLHYYYFVVPFDSSQTTYTFGEVKVIHGTDTQLVNLAYFIPNDSTVHAGAERGDNPELAEVCRSASFHIPDSGHISFFRLLNNSNNSDSYPDSNTANFLAWHITDTTIFRVRLVRDSDEHVLQMLDSIGTFPKLSHAQGDTRFGTFPNVVVASRTLPPNCTGTLAHLEILPTWYGTDEPSCPSDPIWGMSVRRVHYDVNYSAVYDSVGEWNFTPARRSAWSVQKYNELIAYEDSVVQATGCMEMPLPMGFDSVAQRYRFHVRYGGIP